MRLATCRRRVWCQRTKNYGARRNQHHDMSKSSPFTLVCGAYSMREFFSFPNLLFCCVSRIWLRRRLERRSRLLSALVSREGVVATAAGQCRHRHLQGLSALPGGIGRSEIEKHGIAAQNEWTPATFNFVCRNSRLTRRI